MSSGAELLRAALREERAEARRLAWVQRSRRAPLWAWWPRRGLALEVSRAERRLALALGDLHLGVPRTWRQVGGTLYADLDGRLLRASVTSEPFTVKLWCLSPQGEVRVTTARELALAAPLLAGTPVDLQWLRAAQALRRVAWVASALGLLLLLLVNVCFPAAPGLERLGALLVAAAFMLVWRMNAPGLATLLLGLLPSSAALIALLVFTPPALLVPNLLGVILMMAQAAAPLEAALWWTGHTRAGGGEGGGEGGQGAGGIPAQVAPTLPGMTDLTWRPDGATWRCDLPAQEGAPGIGAVTLRLRGARLTLCPVDETTRALWDVPGAGESEVGLERARLGDPEVTLDSEADLIGALASGEPVHLRLVDAQGGAGWAVPPFPPALS